MAQKPNEPVFMVGLAFGSEAYLSSPYLVIDTKSGPVKGLLEGSYRVFKGIPYAAAPVGAKRWRPPQALSPWKTTRPATQFGPDCPQSSSILSQAPAQSEDCLYLNIWTPSHAEPGSLPVMVWVHGGSFVYGSGAEKLFNPHNLLKRDVIVVSFNYRLGIFGFLAHPKLTAESTQQSSSNYGLLDQLAALQWVKDNIEGFGGDSNNITAFGVSAGSGSLSLLQTSPLFQQHYAKTILQSPGTARRLASLEDAEQAGYALGKNIDDLRQLSSAELLAKTPLLTPKVRGLTSPRILRPIRDGWVIALDEQQAFKNQQLALLPAIVGTNADEGSQATASWPINTFQDYKQLLESSFPECPDLAKRCYPVATETDVKKQVAHLFADTQFNYGARLFAKTLAGYQTPVWRYVFTRRYPEQTQNGPHHTQEVAYVFGNFDSPASKQEAAPLINDTDRKLSNAIIDAWTSFAKHGNPNHQCLPNWQMFNSSADNYLDFGDTIQMANNWRRQQLDFLDSYFDDVAQKP